MYVLLFFCCLSDWDRHTHAHIHTHNTHTHTCYMEFRTEKFPHCPVITSRQWTLTLLPHHLSSWLFAEVKSHGLLKSVCFLNGWNNLWCFRTVNFVPFKKSFLFLIIGLMYLQSLNFERIVMSQLNPLKICLPSVVNFFAAITRWIICALLVKVI